MTPKYVRHILEKTLDSKSFNPYLRVAQKILWQKIHKDTQSYPHLPTIAPIYQALQADDLWDVNSYLLGALAAQVNPVVLKYTVDEVSKLTHLAHPMQEGIHVLVVISVILLGKELANIFIQFGQKFYGEKIRINVSSDLAQAAIDKILTYRIAYYNDENHESGKLQIRIDRGIESLTRLVQNFFIDILPLFSNAIIALIIMYMQNVYVGLVSTVIIPIYFYVSVLQAKNYKVCEGNCVLSASKKRMGCSI